MKIIVNVHAGAKRDAVEKVDEKCFKVWVKDPAKEGKANSAVIRVLAEYFHVPKYDVEILSGALTKQKLIEITES